MNILTDSILDETDWLNGGLENTLWECLSDKGNIRVYTTTLSILHVTCIRSSP